jgi:hypothetical protein
MNNYSQVPVKNVWIVPGGDGARVLALLIALWEIASALKQVFFPRVSALDLLTKRSILQHIYDGF